MDKLPIVRLYTVKPDEYIYAVYVIKWLMEHGELPDIVGVYNGTIVNNTYGDWFVWKTKTGYSIQKANNK